MIITIVRSGTSDRTYINPSFASTAEMRCKAGCKYKEQNRTKWSKIKVGKTFYDEMKKRSTKEWWLYFIYTSSVYVFSTNIYFIFV